MAYTEGKFFDYSQNLDDIHLTKHYIFYLKFVLPIIYGMCTIQTSIKHE